MTAWGTLWSYFEQGWVSQSHLRSAGSHWQVRNFCVVHWVQKTRIKGGFLVYPTSPTPRKLSMTMDNPPFEDVFPIEHGGCSNVMWVFRRVDYLKREWFEKKNSQLENTKCIIKGTVAIQEYQKLPLRREPCYANQSSLWAKHLMQLCFRLVFSLFEICLVVWKRLPRWWFQIFFIFTPIWGRLPIWLIFFKGVETTN